MNLLMSCFLVSDESLSLDEAADWPEHLDQTSFSKFLFADVAAIYVTNELKLTANN